MLREIPTCGRVVWYWPTAARKMPALVVDAWEDGHGEARANLSAFSDQVAEPRVWLVREAKQCDAKAPLAGHWSWMPYQEAKALRPEGNQSESAVIEAGDVAPLAPGVGPRVEDDAASGPAQS